MKKAKFILMFVAAAAMMFASCDKDNESDSNSNQGTTTAAFFPTGYNRNNVEAWYTAIEYQNDGQINVQAIYIFNDGSMLSTVYKLKHDGTERREIDAVGTCQLTSGNYTNGTVIVSIPDMNMEMTVTIHNGVFTANEYTFTKQDNANIPSPQQPTGNGGQGGESGELMTEAYLPIAYADKTIEAWYAFSNQENDRIKTEAVFLFHDKSMIVTKSKVYTSGRDPEKEITAVGTYQLTSGDYTNGTLSVTAGDMNITATINNGILNAMGSTYTKQDNANAPEATN